MSDRRPILLAMNNPYSDDPRHALYPHPVGSAGHRLWQMLRARVPTVTRHSYIRDFDRRNLVQARQWSALAARQAADSLVASVQGRVVLVLGSDVRNILGLEPQLVHPIEDRGVTWRQLPHPSGRNLWYNSAENREVAGMLLEELRINWMREQARIMEGLIRCM